MGSLLLRRAFSSLGLPVLLVLVAASVARAQDVAPAHLSLVDGPAAIEREGGLEAATAGIPVIAGDRLRTSSGRAEILFPDGSVLDVDQDTTLDLQSDSLIRVTSGRVLLIVAGAGDPAHAHRYQIDTPAATARTESAGEYRVALLTAFSGYDVELAVIRGVASLSTDTGSMLVYAGERSLARDGGVPSSPQSFNSARFDAFDRWADAQRNDRRGTVSTAYLPRDLQTYGGTFDRYGSWSQEPSYGYVWYPTVGVDWRPYYNGYWTTVRPYGWTWVGLDVWAWPTHHYGRWGVSRNRWFWIPDQRWAPAWVSWADAPGYVSWCPLGFDNRPVVSLTVTSSRLWAGWVVLPRAQFGAPGRLVRQYAVPSPGGSVHVKLVQGAAPPPPVRVSAQAQPPRGGFRDMRAPRADMPARDTSTNVDRSGGRAVPRQGPPPPNASNTNSAGRPSDAPPFKHPLPDAARRRDENASPATSTSPAPPATSAPGARSRNVERRENPGIPPPAQSPTSSSREPVYGARPNRSPGAVFAPPTPPAPTTRPEVNRAERAAPDRPSVSAAEAPPSRTREAPSVRASEAPPVRTEAPPVRAPEAPPAASVRRAVPRQSEDRASGDQQAAPPAGARAARRR